MTAANDKVPPRTVLIVCGDLLTGGPLVQAVRDAGFAPKRALSVAGANADGAAAAILDLSLPGPRRGSRRCRRTPRRRSPSARTS